MDIVEKLAKKSYMENIEFGNYSVRDSINNIRLEVYDFDSQIDKIKFLNYHLDEVNKNYQEHLKVCTSPEQCDENVQAETFIFYLQKELRSLGLELNDDTFTYEEKVTKDSQLEEILRQFEEVKLGNKIIYDDILKEIQELKEFYFLGKKKWHQLLAGKIVEMTAGGIISETVSKDILGMVRPYFNNLLK